MSETIPLLAVRSSHSEQSDSPKLRTSPSNKKTKNQLGTLNGCFVPCCLTIMSASLCFPIPYLHL